MISEEVIKVLKECFGEDTELLGLTEQIYQNHYRFAIKFSVEKGRKIVTIGEHDVDDPSMLTYTWEDGVDSTIDTHVVVLKDENGQEIPPEERAKNDWSGTMNWKNAKEGRSFKDVPLDERLKVAIVPAFTDEGILAWKKK